MPDLLEELNAPELIDSPLIPDEDVLLPAGEIAEGERVLPASSVKTDKEIIREKILQKHNKIRGLVLVAHPDDCLIFAHKFIRAYRKWEWDIVYLTHSMDTARGLEVYKYWRRVEGVSLHFLGFEDNVKDLESNKASFSPRQVWTRLSKVINPHSYKFVLTHNKWGEYGHPHHRVAHYTAHDFMSNISQIYFHGDSIEEHDKFKGKFLHKEIVYDNTPFTAEMFPLHWGVMRTFDLARSMYMIPHKSAIMLSELKGLERNI